MELQAKLLNYFLGSNKSNINQCVTVNKNSTVKNSALHSFLRSTSKLAIEWHCFQLRFSDSLHWLGFFVAATRILCCIDSDSLLHRLGFFVAVTRILCSYVLVYTSTKRKKDSDASLSIKTLLSKTRLSTVFCAFEIRVVPNGFVWFLAKNR